MEDKEAQKDKKIREGLEQLKSLKAISKEQNMDYYLVIFQKDKCIYSQIV